MAHKHREQSSEELYTARVRAMDESMEYQKHLHGVVLYDEDLSE